MHSDAMILHLTGSSVFYYFTAQFIASKKYRASANFSQNLSSRLMKSKYSILKGLISCSNWGNSKYCRVKYSNPLLSMFMTVVHFLAEHKQKEVQLAVPSSIKRGKKLQSQHLHNLKAASNFPELDFYLGE